MSMITGQNPAITREGAATVITGIGAQIYNRMEKPDPAVLAVTGILAVGAIMAPDNLSEYFPLIHRTITTESSGAITEGKIVDLPLSSGKKPDTFTLSTETFIHPFEETIQKIEEFSHANHEILDAMGAMRSMPLYTTLLAGGTNLESTPPSFFTETLTTLSHTSDKTEKIRLILTKITSVLKTVEEHLKNLEPFYQVKIKIENLQKEVSKIISNLHENKTLHQEEILFYKTKISNQINQLKEQINVLRKPQHELTPALDWKGLNLVDTGKLITSTSVLTQEGMTNHLQELQTTHGNVPEILEKLVAIENLLNGYIERPSANQINAILTECASVTQLLSSVQDVSFQTTVKKAISQYGTFLMSRLEEATKTITEEVSDWKRLGEPTEQAQRQMEMIKNFITKMENANLINSQNNHELNPLNIELENLQKAINAKNSRRPLVEGAKTVGTGVLIAGAIVGVKWTLDILARSLSKN